MKVEVSVVPILAPKRITKVLPDDLIGFVYRIVDFVTAIPISTPY